MDVALGERKSLLSVLEAVNDVEKKVVEYPKLVDTVPDDTVLIEPVPIDPVLIDPVLIDPVLIVSVPIDPVLVGPVLVNVLEGEVKVSVVIVDVELIVVESKVIVVERMEVETIVVDPEMNIEVPTVEIRSVMPGVPIVTITTRDGEVEPPVSKVVNSDIPGGGMLGV
jgi:hypothetical protein